MKKLIAKYPILHLAKLYKIGEELPTNEPTMVKAWVENKSAEWKEDDNNEEPAKGTKKESNRKSKGA